MAPRRPPRTGAVAAAGHCAPAGLGAVGLDRPGCRGGRGDLRGAAEPGAEPRRARRLLRRAGPDLAALLSSCDGEDACEDALEDYLEALEADDDDECELSDGTLDEDEAEAIEECAEALFDDDDDDDDDD